MTGKDENYGRTTEEWMNLYDKYGNAAKPYQIMKGESDEVYVLFGGGSIALGFFTQSGEFEWSRVLPSASKFFINEMEKGRGKDKQ